MSEIFYAQVVTEFDTEHFVVKRMFYNKPNPYLNAVLLSPLPDGAMRTSLDPAKTHYCFCVKDGMNVGIIGFVPPHGSSTFNDSAKPPNEKNGFELATGPIGMLKGYEDGSVGLIADPWSQILFEPRPKSITMKARNFIMNVWTGFINYITTDDRANLKFFMSKFQDKTAVAGYENSAVPDSITTEIGTIDGTNAIVRSTILQNSAADSIVETQGGDSVRELTFPKGKITIANNGDVTIKLDSTAKIYLGGSGSEQQLVTKNWVLNIFKEFVLSDYLNHTHLYIPPAPTYALVPVPTQPVIQPVTRDLIPDTTDAFTQMTKAD